MNGHRLIRRGRSGKTGTKPAEKGTELGLQGHSAEKIQWAGPFFRKLTDNGEEGARPLPLGEQ